MGGAQMVRGGYQLDTEHQREGLAVGITRGRSYWNARDPTKLGFKTCKVLYDHTRAPASSNISDCIVATVNSFLPRYETQPPLEPYYLAEWLLPGFEARI